MKYVELNATIGGLEGVISPEKYLAALPELAPQLPQGARAFATDPGHYDFYGQRCVKDLKLSTVSVTVSSEGELVVEIYLRHNCFKHEEDLIIRYQGVTELRVGRPDNWAAWPINAGLILDETLPHARGCSSELAFIGADIHVVCRDLEATWIDTDCPDKPAAGAGSADG